MDRIVMYVFRMVPSDGAATVQEACTSLLRRNKYEDLVPSSPPSSPRPYSPPGQQNHLPPLANLLDRSRTAGYRNRRRPEPLNARGDREAAACPPGLGHACDGEVEA